MMIMNKRRVGLYLHIPFCEKKCRYCGFLSFDIYGLSIYEEYTKGLISEIKSYNDVFRKANVPDTIFIGGGTPSLLSEKQINRIMECIFESFDVAREREITIEANPNSLTYEKLMAYKKAGINRISMGAQSMDDRVLASLGRVHKRKDVISAYENAVKVGFDNVNIDLMYGIPEQSEESVFESLKEICDLEPKHISFYGLQLEEETIFYEEYKSGMIDLPDENLEKNIYHKAIKYLESKGYEHYEISNFAKPGFKSMHNSKYWDLEDYIGIGLGAHSYIHGARSKNVDDMKEYLNLTSKGKSPVDSNFYHVDSEKDKMAVYVFTGLRKREGISLSEFEARFGKGLFEIYKDITSELKRYMDEGYLEISGDRFRLTESGIDISNDVMSEFV